ncbi:MAG: hypothetical protein MHM6MM_008731 [Cercozoa sp. M6MM]
MPENERGLSLSRVLASFGFEERTAQDLVVAMETGIVLAVAVRVFSGTSLTSLMRNRVLENALKPVKDEMKQFGNRLTGVEAQITGLSMKCDALELKLDGLESKFDGKFDALESKFDGKFDALESKFDGKFDALESKFDGKFDALESKLEKLFVEQQEREQRHLRNKAERKIEPLEAELALYKSARRPTTDFKELEDIDTFKPPSPM